MMYIFWFSMPMAELSWLISFKIAFDERAREYLTELNAVLTAGEIIIHEF